MRTAKAILFALAGLIAGGLVFNSGLRKFRETRDLKRDGATAEAGIIDQRIRYSSKGRTHYYLTVEFEATGRRKIRRETEVDDDTHSNASAQGVVKVHYLPSNPDVFRAGAVVKTEYGDLLLGGFLFFCGIGSFLFLRQPASRQKSAGDVGDMAQSPDPRCDAEHQLITVDGREFTGVDHHFYNACQSEFENHGFVFLSDIEVVTTKPAKGMTRTFVRLLLSGDRTQIANIFHVRPGFLMRMLGAKDARVCGVDTQMSDLSFVCTDNAEGCGAVDSPSEINSAHLPAASTVETILSAHASRLEAHGIFRAATSPVLMQAQEDVLRSVQLQNQIKAAHRRKADLNKSELDRLAGMKNSQIAYDRHTDPERDREPSRRDAA